MANEQNLKPQNKRTKSEQREIAIKGGKASGKARSERKKLKEELLALLSDGDTQEKICIALIRQAQRGNIRAFEVMRDTIGERPTDEKDSSAAEAADKVLDAIKEQTDAINGKTS